MTGYFIGVGLSLLVAGVVFAVVFFVILVLAKLVDSIA